MLDGDRVKEGETFSRLSSALASLRLDDVRPMPVSVIMGSTARFVTFDGVKVTAQLLTDGDTHWASFDVAVDPPMVMPDAFGKLSDKLDGWQFALPTTAAERLIIPLEDWLTRMTARAETRVRVPHTLWPAQRSWYPMHRSNKGIVDMNVQAQPRAKSGLASFVSITPEMWLPQRGCGNHSADHLPISVRLAGLVDLDPGALSS